MKMFKGLKLWQYGFSIMFTCLGVLNIIYGDLDGLIYIGMAGFQLISAGAFKMYSDLLAEYIKLSDDNIMLSKLNRDITHHVRLNGYKLETKERQ